MVYKVSFLVVAFVSIAASTYSISDGELNNVCRQIQDPSFCFALLNSNHSTNLVNFAQYTIDVAHANVTNTIKLINTLIAQSAGDLEAIKHYKSCLERFDYDSGGALFDVEDAKEMLKKGNYIGMSSAASAISTEASACVDGGAPEEPIYNDHSILPKYVAVLDLVVEIICVISNILSH